VPGFRPGAKRGVTVIGIAPPATGTRSPISEVPKPAPAPAPAPKPLEKRPPALVAAVEDNIPEWSDDDTSEHPKSVPSTGHESVPPEETATETRPAAVSAPRVGGAPPPAAGRPVGQAAAPRHEDDATRPVPRTNLLQGQQKASFVVAEDAVGEDATLAAMAPNAMLAGFGGRMGGPPPPSPVADHPAYHEPDSAELGQRLFDTPNVPAGPGGAPQATWDDPPQWSPNAPQGAPQTALQARLGSNPQLQDIPPSQPLAFQGQGYNPAPVGPPSYAGAMPPAAPPKKLKLSGQVILLIVVGVICISVFITGVVLFATTR
jgi:hypothetical protein